MLKVNIHEAKTQLSRHLERLIRQGESILLCKRNVPVAEIRPLPRTTQQPRKVGLAKNEFKIPKEFFEPLPKDLKSLFSGKKQ